MKTERMAPAQVKRAAAIKYAVKIAEEYKKEPVISARYMGGGSFGRAVLTRCADGSECVVKLLCAEGMLSKEVYDLKLLRSHCRVKMPEIYYVRESGGEIPFDAYCMEKLPGKPALYDLKLLLSGKRIRQTFAEETAEGLGSLHSVTDKKFGDTAAPQFQSWRECYGNFAAEVLDKALKYGAEGALPDKITFVMKAAWTEFDGIFGEEPEEAVLIHGDLNVANIMVDKDHRLCGFIDPLNSMYADREYDLFQFLNLTGKRFRLAETYFEKFGASEMAEYKLAFYGLWNEVYCFIRSGVLIPLIMDPLVNNMKRKLSLS